MTLSCKTLSLALALLLLNFLPASTGQNVQIGENYYRAVTAQKVNWHRAFRTCVALGMQLASIENSSDLEELKNYLFSQSLLSNNYWLAGNNLASRGEYVWLSSGNKITYTKWAPSQPGFTSNRCVRTNYNFEWVTEACSNANYFICSRPAQPECGVYGQCSAVTYEF